MSTSVQTVSAPSSSSPAAPFVQEYQQDIDLVMDEPLADLIPVGLRLDGLTDEEIRKEGILITSKSLDPEENGINSLKMGGVDDGSSCITCRSQLNCSSFSCPGHMGYIHLAVPVVKTKFFEQLILVLISICRGCGVPILPIEELEKLSQVLSGPDLLNEIAKKSVEMKCSTRPDRVPKNSLPCTQNPKYKKQDSVRDLKILKTEPGHEKESEMPVKEAWDLLKILSDLVILTLNEKERDYFQEIRKKNGEIEGYERVFLDEGIISDTVELTFDEDDEPEFTRIIVSEEKSKKYGKLKETRYNENDEPEYVYTSIIEDRPEMVTVNHLLGFRGRMQPKDLITKYLPVIPPRSRPPRYRDGVWEEDGLTLAYATIWDRNQDIIGLSDPEATPKKKGRRTTKKSTATKSVTFTEEEVSSGPVGVTPIERLNQAIAALIETKNTNTARRAQNADIIGQIKGKTGVLRGAMAVRRVDFSGRSTIGPDSRLEVDQVAIPNSMAKDYTIPHPVTAFNLEKIRKWWREGEVRTIQYAKRTEMLINGQNVMEIQLEPGEFEITDEVRETYEPQIGDVVRVLVQDDDRVILNRNPTLWTFSMNGHRIKRTPDRLDAQDPYMRGTKETLRINLGVTTQYNADFDGDEMNLHLPQTMGAQIELEELMSVANCPRSGGPVMGIVFDALTATPVLTRDLTRVPFGLFEEIRQRLQNPYVGSLFERLEQAGHVYRYRTVEFKTSTPGLVQQLLELGVVNAIRNPPEDLDVPEEMIEEDGGEFSVVYKVHYPLSENNRKALELTEDLETEEQDELTGKAVFSALLPPGFVYSRKGKQYTIYTVNNPSSDLLDTLKRARIPMEMLIVYQVPKSARNRVLSQLLESGFSAKLNPDGVQVPPDEKLPDLGYPKVPVVEFSNKEGFGSAIREVFRRFPGLDARSRLAGTPGVRIENGILISGQVAKKDIGAGNPGSIHDRMAKYYPGKGTRMASLFLSELPWLVNRWAVNFGFSMGYKDCLIPEDEMAKIRQEVAKARLQVESLGPEPKDPVAREKWEEQLISYLHRPGAIGEQIQEKVLDPDSFMVLSTKGGGAETMAITTGVGQQFLKGKRLGAGMDRLLPHHKHGIQDIFERGYIQSSLSEGMKMTELYMAALAVRRDIATKGLETAVSGYFNRRITAMLRDLVVQYDGSVRDSRGNLYQLAANSDLLDTAQLEGLDFADVDYLADMANNITDEEMAAFGFLV